MVIFMNSRPMLNAYPDSMGGKLSDIVEVLSQNNMKDVFGSFYILPSIYHSDLDRGFSVIDYNLNEELAEWKDLEELKKLGIALKLDFILNHASAQSQQFTDLVQHGDQSEYKDFFINWNEFWQGYGSMTEDGYVQPESEYLEKMFFRKPGLPILMVKFPDGKKVPYWNTFYQEEHYPLYLGQMDLNIKSQKVWDFYKDTLKKIASYGAEIVRLDAFAYAPKEPGEKNFLNEPGTWNLLERIQQLADKYELTLLPEIHSSYEEKTYEILSQKGYMAYDFFLPGLIIDAFEEQSGEMLEKWAQEILDKQINVVNMLGCHDGIPLLDLKGLIKDEQIQRLIDTVVGRGGFVKNLHGQKNVYYQVNATYYSALGEDDRKMLISRAVQLFMPGKPQVWYLDLFAGKNDYEAVRRAGAGGHKEINRTNLSMEDIEEALKKDVVMTQLKLLRFRKNFPAFEKMNNIKIQAVGSTICFTWENEGYIARLNADFRTCEFKVEGIDPQGDTVFNLEN